MKKDDKLYELINDFEGFDQWIGDLTQLMYDGDEVLIVNSKISIKDVNKKETDYKNVKVKAGVTLQ